MRGRGWCGLGKDWFGARGWWCGFGKDWFGASGGCSFKMAVGMKKFGATGGTSKARMP